MIIWVETRSRTLIERVVALSSGCKERRNGEERNLVPQFETAAEKKKNDETTLVRRFRRRRGIMESSELSQRPNGKKMTFLKRINLTEDVSLLAPDR